MDIEGMRRVNHAGEWGAVYIYKGQAFVLPNDADIQHMQQQEEEHLKAFTKHLVQHQTRPSWLQPLWAVGGFVLGAATAFMGRKMAHTCTVAVEEVIEEHYAEQLQELQGQEPELAGLIEKFAKEEAEHRQMASEAIDHAPYPIAASIIRRMTQAAITIAKRI